MKKIFSTMLVAAVMVFACVAAQSCKTTNGPAFAYSVTVTGDADGNVNVSFPDGSLNLTGTANLDFVYCNDTVEVFETPVAFEDALVANDANLAAFAAEVEEAFTVASASGTYYVSIDGYVKQPDSGLVIEIHKVFTNRADKDTVVE